MTNPNNTTPDHIKKLYIESLGGNEAIKKARESALKIAFDTELRLAAERALERANSFLEDNDGNGV